MNAIPIAIRLVLSVGLTYLMWRESGWPTGVLAVVVLASAELQAVINRMHRERIDRLEQSLAQTASAVTEHLQRRELFRRLY